MPLFVSKTVRAVTILVILCSSGQAAGGDIDFTKVGRKDLFKDLPGVGLPVDPLKSKNACTSMIRSEYFPYTGRHMPVRVYTCRQGDMVFESTVPPDEDAWRRYRQNQR